jgi:hypothetical protein
LGQGQSTEHPEHHDKTKEKEKPDLSTAKDDKKKPQHTPIPVTTQLRLLMMKTNVTTAELDKVVMYASEDVHFIKEPHGPDSGRIALSLSNGMLRTATANFRTWWKSRQADLEPKSRS